MDKLKSSAEIRADLERLGIARYYYQATMQFILRMFENGVFPTKEPIIECVQGTHRPIKKINEKQWKAWIDYHIFKQMLQDRRLLDAYLLGEEIVPRYDTVEKKNKTYLTAKFYPQCRVKKILVYTDND